MDKMLKRIFSLLPHKPDGKLAHGAKKELANRLNLDSSVLTQWESGKNKSYNRYIYQIAALYGVSPDWLRGDVDDPTPTPPAVPETLSFKKEELRRLVQDVNPYLTDAERLELLGELTLAHDDRKKNEKRER